MVKIRTDGNFIGRINNPTSTIASGIWSLKDVERSLSTSAWPQQIPESESNFYLNTILLHGDGNNGANNSSFVDSSNFAYTITRNGAPIQGTFTPYSQTGWSNFFDGTGDYLTVPSNTALAFGTGDYTIEAWIYRNEISRQQCIVDTRGASPGVGVLFYYTAQGYLSGYDGTTVYIGNSTATVVSPFVWHHVAMTRAGGETRLYIDGVSVASITGDTRNNLNGASGTLIGRQFGSTTNDKNGFISNLRIVKGTALYTGASYDVPTSPLTNVSGTSLLTCQDRRFIDNSSNLFTLTPSGAPQVHSLSPLAPTSAYSTSTVGGSIYFSGNTDSLSIPSGALVFGSNNFTLEAWIYTPNTNISGNGGEVIFDNWIGANPNYVTNQFQFWIVSTGVLRFQYATGTSTATSISSTATVPLNVWNHIAAVKTDSTLDIYLNGTNVANGTLSISSVGVSGTSSIGKQSSGNPYYFNGYISNVRVLNGTALYNGNFTPPSAPLTAITDTRLLLNATNAGIIDHTAKNNLQTFASAAISSTQSRFGGTSIFFNGSSDYISTVGTTIGTNPGDLGTGDFTIEMWMRASAAGTYVAMVGTQTVSGFATAGMWRVSNRFNSTNALYFNYTTGSAYTDVSLSATNINDGNWHHIAVTRRSNTLRGFVDGVLGSNTSITQNLNSGKQLYLGYNAQDLAYYSGYLDEVRITKGYARYINNFTPPEAPFANQ